MVHVYVELCPYYMDLNFGVTWDTGQLGHSVSDDAM